MPKLWNETIEAHRREVRDAILDATAALVFEQGLRSVTMSKIAEKAGIGRATLYKYFPDVDAILLAWHAGQITAHLHQLAEIRDGVADPGQRLAAVLTAYAHIVGQTRGHRDTELGAFRHRDDHVAHAQHQLRALIGELLAEEAKTGAVRTDVPSDELAAYCLHALAAANNLSEPAALARLVAVTMAGLRNPA